MSSYPSAVLHKIDAAAHQIDWAIRLLVDLDDPVPAITLAGAADEMLGNLIGDQAAAKVLHDTLAPRYPRKPGMTDKQVRDRLFADRLNRVRNWLKHGTIGDPLTLDSEPHAEAVQLIARATCNLIEFDRSLSSEFQRFYAWVQVRDPAMAKALSGFVRK